MGRMRIHIGFNGKARRKEATKRIQTLSGRIVLKRILERGWRKGGYGLNSCGARYGPTEGSC
jgi:hypothetical protein